MKEIYVAVPKSISQVKLVIGKVVFTASVTSEIEQVSTLLPLSISTLLSSYTDCGICVGSK